MRKQKLNNMKIGFTIGKFAPLHKGHELLIKKGINEMDKFYVVIYDTDKIDIDIKRRAYWINTLYPSVIILYAYNPPSKFGLDEESVKIQMEYLETIIKDIKVTHFYSSELYGEKVANYLKIKNVLVDMDRKGINISATKIRNNIEKYRDFLSDIVYNDIKE